MRFIILAQSNITTKKFDVAEAILYDNIEVLVGVKGRDEFWKGVNYELLSRLYEETGDHYSALKYAENAKKIYERTLDEDINNSYENIIAWIDYLNGKDLYSDSDRHLKMYYQTKGDEVVANKLDSENTTHDVKNFRDQDTKNHTESNERIQKLETRMQGLETMIKKAMTTKYKRRK